jgi:hypothetical protein
MAEIVVKKLLCCGFRRTGKGMGQSVSMLEDKCFFQVRISYVFVLYPFF